MPETEQEEIARLRKRTSSPSQIEARRRGGLALDKIHGKAHRRKFTRRGGQTVVLKYGNEYMRQLGRKGGLATQAKLRKEAASGKESEG